MSRKATDAGSKGMAVAGAAAAPATAASDGSGATATATWEEAEVETTGVSWVGGIAAGADAGASAAASSSTIRAEPMLLSERLVANSTTLRTSNSAMRPRK
jgi:hypothetical protein